MSKKHLKVPKGPVNAKRVPWGKVGFLKKGGTGFQDGYLDHAREMSVCFDLVKIGSHVLGKPLFLKAGGPNSSPPILKAATDGRNIFLPKMHPQLRIVTKHELAHNYFLSDLPMRLAFVNHILDEMEEESSKKFPNYLRDRLINDLCFFINILDDIRVNSLWGLLYPGDGRDMDAWYFDEVGADMMEKAQKQYKDGDIDHLFTYAILRCLDQPATSSKWGRFEEDIDQAAEDVKLKSFNACLLVCKRLIRKIARKLAEEEKEEESQPAWGGNADPVTEQEQEGESKVGGSDELDQQMKGLMQDGDPGDLVKAMTGMETGNKPDDTFADHNAGFDFDKQIDISKMANRYKQLQLRSLQNVDVDDDDACDSALLQQEDAGIQTAQDIQKKLDSIPYSGNYPSEGEYLKKGVKASVRIVNVKRSDIVPTVLDLEDIKTAERWYRYFLRVMGVLALRTDHTGYELIPDLYIQQKINREPFECFRRDTTGRGFRVNLLVDMSSSMRSRFHHVQKLAAVLQRALNFNFVHLKVYGFNCTQKGVVNIHVYPKNAEGLIAPGSRVEGVTPLSQAIQIAGRDLTGHRDDNHLFVLGDGFPVYVLKGKNRAVNTKALMNWTADAVKDLRKRKVHTHCFMIGNSTPGAQDMDRMFGNRGWKKIGDDQIYADSFEFITRNFMQYLRRR